MATVEELIVKRNTLMAKLKNIKEQLKDEIESTEIYKAILESSVHTVDEDAYDVSEKDAAKHAFKLTLKNYESKIEKEK
jgi:hypothetical protein